MKASEIEVGMKLWCRSYAESPIVAEVIAIAPGTVSVRKLFYRSSQGVFKRFEGLNPDRFVDQYATRMISRVIPERFEEINKEAGPETPLEVLQQRAADNVKRQIASSILEAKKDGGPRLYDLVEALLNDISEHGPITLSDASSIIVTARRIKAEIDKAGDPS